MMIPLTKFVRTRQENPCIFRSKLILAGDPFQMGPIVSTNEECRLNLNLHVSFMEKVYVNSENIDHDSINLTRLEINYRSLPQIVRLYRY